MSTRMMTLNFRYVHQHAQQIGGDDEFLTASVLGSLEPHGRPKESMIVNVKQPIGERSGGPLEVSLPEGYHGSIDYQAFRIAVERYYRSLVGGSSAGISVGPEDSVFMADNTFEHAVTVQIPMP